MKRRLHISVVCILALGLCAAGSAKSQTAADTQWESVQPGIVVDHAYFRSDAPESLRLEVYYKIHNLNNVISILTRERFI